MSLENITAKILAEAEAVRRTALEEAEIEADSVLKAAEAKAREIVESAEKRGKDEKDKIILRRKSVADIDSRKIILSSKQEMISACVDSAVEKIIGMDEDKYIDLLVNMGLESDIYGGLLLFNPEERERIGQKVCDLLNEGIAERRKRKFGDEVQYTNRFELDKLTGDMVGGYVITYRLTYADCTIESLVRESRDKVAGEAAKMLFSE